jgi:ADP-heptose:LPS heptosyltransferase
LQADLFPLRGVTFVGTKVPALQPSSINFVFIGHRISAVENAADFVRKVAAALRVGGCLVFSLAELDQPDPTQVQNFQGNDWQQLLPKGAWKVLAQHTADQHRCVVLRKLQGKPRLEWAAKPAAKRACIVRYGAIGDMIQVTPLIRKLAEDGYEVHVNCTTYSAEVLNNNPYVYDLHIQEKAFIPNAELGPYWQWWEQRYDKYINLSESIEGTLLKIQPRRDYYSTQAFRHETCNVNYIDRTMALGGYPQATGEQPQLFLTEAELVAARAWKAKHMPPDAWMCVWGLRGTSPHKMYGQLPWIMGEWLQAHPKARLVTTGDVQAKLLEFDHPQVVQAAGELTLRETFALAAIADCVGGPESMLVNAASCFDVPKVVLLSHSTEENLTKHWRNCIALAPDVERAPCYPCHQMHSTAASCVTAAIDDRITGQQIMQGPACAMGAISQERLAAALDTHYQTAML